MSARGMDGSFPWTRRITAGSDPTEHRVGTDERETRLSPPSMSHECGRRMSATDPQSGLPEGPTSPLADQSRLANRRS